MYALSKRVLSSTVFVHFYVNVSSYLAIAKVYLEEGDEGYKNKEALNAICDYTEGLQVNCKDDELNAKLYCNRAKANFHLGRIISFSANFNLLVLNYWS